MSYRDWSSDDYDEFYERNLNEIYYQLPTVPDLPPDINEEALELYEKGWLTFGEYSKDELDDIRNDFYDLIGITEDQFDWADWRDLYSEVNG